MRTAGRVEIGLGQEASGDAGACDSLGSSWPSSLRTNLRSFSIGMGYEFQMANQTIDDLPTPALILDRAILRRNLKRMSDRLRTAGVGAAAAPENRQVGAGRSHGGRGP